MTRLLEVRLTLGSPSELFVARNVDPLAEDYPPHGDVSGVEHVVNEFYAEPRYDAIAIEIALPIGEITPGIDDTISTAIGRWSRARRRDADEEVRASRWRGRRTLAAAFVALFVFIGLSRILGSFDNLILEILSEGLSIAGWVALWFPLEVLMFNVWQHRLDRRAYEILGDADISVVSR